MSRHGAAWLGTIERNGMTNRRVFMTKQAPEVSWRVLIVGWEPPEAAETASIVTRFSSSVRLEFPSKELAVVYAKRIAKALRLKDEEVMITKNKTSFFSAAKRDNG